MPSQSHTTAPSPPIARPHDPPSPRSLPTPAPPPPPASPPHPPQPPRRHAAAPLLRVRPGYPGGHKYTPPPPPLPAQYHRHPDKHYRYDGHAQYVTQPFPIAHGGYVPYRTILNVPMAPTQSSGGGAGVIQVVHMDRDDAATKLSDREAKLCNKCGLFERTHSRPRPQQFPHKRGLPASLTLRSHSPPPAQLYQTPVHYPPPGPRSYPASAPLQRRTLYPNPSAPVNDFASANGSASGQHNGSASHPSTPDSQSVNPSPKLPGVDSLRPPSPDKRREREERDDRRERSPE
ncbi:hypothetical protein B0H13DRAFT_2271032 [Mycena leptocephala]|nr:hypothetical protein B0H13DRAFT_2271032 [Mycena leptocephala]